jgi:hypothetical protein
MDSERSYFLDRSAEMLVRLQQPLLNTCQPVEQLTFATVDFISSFLTGTSFQLTCRVVAKPIG